MFDIFRHTPLWVYAIFFIVTYSGVNACFRNHETKRSLLVTPIIFVTISLLSLKFSLGIAVPLSFYALGLSGGWIAAQRFYSYCNVEREGDRLVLGGSVKVLAVYWMFFGWRYYSGYQIAMHPELADQVFMIVFSSLGAGIINGLIIGRCLRLLRFFRSDNVNVSSMK
jgi:hypothetical protein